MRTVRILAAAGLFVALVPFPASSAAAGTETVTIPGNYFSPQTVKIYVGDTVRWFNDSARNHTVTSNSDSDESFNSSTNCPGGLLSGNDCIRPSRSFAHTFNTPGKFTYHCRIHGSNATFPNCGMCGRVQVVRRKASPTNPPTSPGSSLSPSVPVSVSPSTSPGASPTGNGTVAAPTGANGPGGDGNAGTIAIAAVGVALLGGAGFAVYRTMIRR